MNNIGYTGISFPFRFNGRGGVAKSTTTPDDFSHIEESIYQIVCTFKKERPMELDFGSDANASIFSNATDNVDVTLLKYYIEEAIKEWESRVKVDKITVNTVTDNDSSETYNEAEVHCTVLKYMQSLTVKVPLK
jgi:phage baseplate assembly protein W